MVHVCNTKQIPNITLTFFTSISSLLQHKHSSTELKQKKSTHCHSPLLDVYTPMYIMVCVTFIESSISQQQISSTPPLLRCISTTIGSLVLWKSHWSPLLGTTVPLGKDHLPKNSLRQQVVRLVTQRRASSPSPMSSRVTILLFWYVVKLSEN